MHFQFVASTLSVPTQETLRIQVEKAFQKLKKFVEEDFIVRVSVDKEGDLFLIKVEIPSLKVFSEERNRDLRKAVNFVSKDLRNMIVKRKEKALLV